jgi:hypothetical protein
MNQSAAASVTILPDLETARGGVAAFGLALARRFGDGRARAPFIVLRPPPAALEVPVLATAPRADALCRALEQSGATHALLHFSGYGYAPDACPEWLPAGLARWRQAPGRRVSVYFHELMTDEPWWTRTYWTQRRQKRIVDQLALGADSIATNCGQFAAQLAQRHGAGPGRVVVAPVPPTLVDGVPATGRLPADDARLTALVFGLRGTRARTLAMHRRLLEALAREGGLERVVVAGADAQADELRGASWRHVRVDARPGLDSAALAALGAEVDFGLVWNWPAILTKSTVFANLCALGVPTVAVRRGEANAQLPVLLSNDGREDVMCVGAELRQPARRAAWRAAALAAARTQLSWDRAVRTLETHFFR